MLIATPKFTIMQRWNKRTSRHPGLNRLDSSSNPEERTLDSRLLFSTKVLFSSLDKTIIHLPVTTIVIIGCLLIYIVR